MFKHVAMRRRICVALEFIAHKKTDTELTEQNKQAMALTHGFAHGVVQSVLFSIRYAQIAFLLTLQAQVLLRPIPASIHSMVAKSMSFSEMDIPATQCDSALQECTCHACQNGWS